MALAIFDLDDTLIDGDCASLWSAHMADLGWVDRDSFLARDHELMTLYAEGKLAMEDYMACQSRMHKRHGLNPWVRKIPWRRKWQPTPVFLPGESRRQRSMASYSPWGHKKLDTTEAI